jgi:hypothetical protein
MKNPHAIHHSFQLRFNVNVWIRITDHVIKLYVIQYLLGGVHCVSSRNVSSFIEGESTCFQHDAVPPHFAHQVCN